MEERLYAKRIRWEYENVYPECPHCGRESALNRQSDLGTVRGVSFAEVICQSQGCGKPFAINGDSINPTHQKILWECEGLLKEKRYGRAIEDAVKALEIFCGLYCQAELLWRPFGRRPRLDQNLSDLNEAAGRFRKHWKELRGFDRKRNVVLHFASQGERVKDVARGRELIEMIPSIKVPSPAEMAAVSDLKLRELLERLRDLRANVTRNKVSHRGYRPTREEAEGSVKEIYDLAIRLGAKFMLFADDAETYISFARREGVSTSGKGTS